MNWQEDYSNIARAEYSNWNIMYRDFDCKNLNEEEMNRFIKELKIFDDDTLAKLKWSTERLKVKYNPELVVSTEGPISTLSAATVSLLAIAAAFNGDNIFGIIFLSVIAIIVVNIISKTKKEIQMKVNAYTEALSFFTFYESVVLDEIERRK